MKRFFQILLFLLFTALVVALMVYVYLEHEKKPLGDIVIHVARPTDEGFLDKSEIYDYIESFISDTVKLKDVNLGFIEDSLAKNPWVENLDAFTDIDGDLIINIREVEPLLRVFNREGVSFLLDKQGKILPLSKKYSPRLLVANGYIDVTPRAGYKFITDTVYRNSDLKALKTITDAINGFPFLQSLIGEIYVNSKNEFDLIPIVNGQLIHLGDTTNLNQKLENLIVFYKKSLVYEGWDKYKTLNLKYRNQIVCTKN